MIDMLYDKIKQKFPDVAKYIDQIGDIVANSQEIVKPVRLIKTIVDLMNGSELISHGLFGIADYGNELAADSLAAKYGYGPELITGLKKLQRPINTTSNYVREHTGTFGSVMTDLVELSCDILAMMSLDPHPNDNQRARSTLDKLKRDLKKGDYPPEMKRDLEKEIERMEKTYNTVNDVSYGDKNVQIKKTWYTILDTVTRGHSDVRELLTPYWNLFTF